MALAGVIISGYVVGVVPLVWMLRDLSRLHPHLWSGYGRPHPWKQAAWLSYLFGGWPVFVVAVVWRTGEPRSRMEQVKRQSNRRVRTSRSG